MWLHACDDVDDVPGAGAGAGAEGDAVPIRRFWSCHLGPGYRSRRRSNGRSYCFALSIRADLALDPPPTTPPPVSRDAVVKNLLWNCRLYSLGNRTTSCLSPSEKMSSSPVGGSLRPDRPIKSPTGARNQKSGRIPTLYLHPNRIISVLPSTNLIKYEQVYPLQDPIKRQCKHCLYKRYAVPRLCTNVKQLS